MLKNNKIIMALAFIGMAFGADADPVAVAAAGSLTKGLAGIGAGLAVIGAGIGIGKI